MLSMQNLLDGRGVAGEWPQIVEKLYYTLLSVGVGPERIDDPNLAKMDGGGQSGRLGVAGDEFDVLNTTTLSPDQHWLLLQGPTPSPNQLTSGIVSVLIMDLEARFQRRRVLSLMIARLGFKIDSGTTKSEVRMMFLSQSTLSPCGLNGWASILA
jgi:hypothetical protein